MSLSLWEMKNKTTLDFLVRQSEHPRSKIQITINAGEYLRERNHFFIVGWSANYYSHYRNHCKLPHKEKNRSTHVSKMLVYLRHEIFPDGSTDNRISIRILCCREQREQNPWRLKTYARHRAPGFGIFPDIDTLNT